MIRLAVVILSLFLSGCITYVKVPQASLESDNVVKIVAEDDSFMFSNNQLIQTPFSIGRPVYEFQIKNSGIIETYKYALKHGAKPVRIYFKDKDVPYYGILAFFDLPSNAGGPGARSCLIQIPSSYVTQAQDGKISLVYEKVAHSNNYVLNWALWFSDRKFY